MRRVGSVMAGMLLLLGGVIGCSSSSGPDPGGRDGASADLGAVNRDMVGVNPDLVGSTADLSSQDSAPGCGGDIDCGGATPRCDTTTGMCVACLAAGDCGGADGGASLGCCNHVCANLGSSASHCGACGHDCLGGACAMATCQPLSIPSYAETFTVDDANLYWIEYNIASGTGAIRSAPKGSTTPTTLVPQTTGGAIAVDATSLYWLQGSAGTTVFTAPKSGAAMGTVLGSSGAGNYADRIALDPGHVYWIGHSPFSSDECVFQISKTGGAISSPYICAGAGVSFREGLIAADASGVYHIQSGSGGGALYREIPQMSVSMVLWSGGGLYGTPGVALDPVNVYFTDYRDVGSISTVAKTGGMTRVLVTGRVRPAAIAVDNTNVYWIENQSAVMTVSRTGGTPKALYTGAAVSLIDYGPLIIDATRVYWLSSGNTIMQLAK